MAMVFPSGSSIAVIRQPGRREPAQADKKEPSEPGLAGLTPCLAFLGKKDSAVLRAGPSWITPASPPFTIRARAL